MTINTPLGKHHMKLRKISYNPKVRGSQHSKGKSPLKIFNRIRYRGLRHLGEKRYQRKIDRAENVNSKERNKIEFLSDEVDSVNSQSPIEDLLKTLSKEAYVAFKIIREGSVDYKDLKTRLGEKKAKRARNELENLGLAYFDERYYLHGRRPEVSCCIPDGIQPELEKII